MSEHTLMSMLRDALGGLPQARIEQWEQQKTVDAMIDLTIGAEPVRLLVEARKTLFPRDAGGVLFQLGQAQALIPPGRGQTLLLVAAEVLSPGTMEMLRRIGVGYFDGGGSLFLPAAGAYVFIDRPPSRSRVRKAEAIFAGARARVLHAVWLNGGDGFGVHEIAAEAAVSPATASETLTALERHDWVEASGAGPAKVRRLTDRRGLLDAWAEYQRRTPPPSQSRYFVPGASAEALPDLLDVAASGEDVTYAVTGVVAAQRYAPHLTHVSQMHCRIHAADMAGVLASLGARPVSEGWNLAVIETPSPADLHFRRRLDEAWYADPLQTYLDLLHISGRAKELAEQLRAQVLAP